MDIQGSASVNWFSWISGREWLNWRVKYGREFSSEGDQFGIQEIWNESRCCGSGSHTIPLSTIPLLRA